jgi:hypothetical protein
MDMGMITNRSRNPTTKLKELCTPYPRLKIVAELRADGGQSGQQHRSLPVVDALAMDDRRKLIKVFPIKSQTFIKS